MTFLSWAIASAIAVQSLGEVAEREKKRRERNAEAGIEAVSFTGTGSGDVVETAPGGASDAEDGAATPTAPSLEENASPLEAERERGKAFEPRMAEISRAADRVDRLYQRYLNRCHNRYAIGVTPPGIGVPVPSSMPVNVEVGRNWFVVLDAPSATSTAVPRSGPSNIMLVQTVECQELWRDIFDAASGVKQSMRALLADARREGILPGVIRELRRKYRLEWSGWER